MGLAAPQRHQPAQAADIGRDEPQPFVPFGQELGQQVEGEVVAADGHQGAGDVARVAVEVDGDGRARVGPLAEARNTNDAVGAHQRSDDSRAAADGCHRRPFAHLADDDAHEVLVAGVAGDLAR